MNNCLTRLLAIIGKEVQQLRRDRLTFGMIVGIPIIQILLFGYAIDTDVRHLPAVFADQAQTQLSRRLLADAEATQVVDIVARVVTGEQLRQYLDRGEMDIGILIPFEAKSDRQSTVGLASCIRTARSMTGRPSRTEDLAWIRCSTPFCSPGCNSPSRQCSISCGQY